MLQKAGRITAAGMIKEVNFEPVNGPSNDQIDDAYRAKYHDSPYSPSPASSSSAKELPAWKLLMYPVL
jgi:hypothetical protein